MADTILIIGGGAAGLSAAQTLSLLGIPVTLLEARNRLGGRMYTVVAQPGGFPIDLGAEFVHGAQNAVWEVIREAKLRTRRVPDRHWRLVRGKWVEEKRFWDQLGEATARINSAAPDQDVQSFLDEAWSLSPAAQRLAKEYVEGFHAAPANRMGVHALARAEEAAERDEGTQAFQINQAYAALIHWYSDQLTTHRAEVHLNTEVETVRWTPGHVEVQAQTGSGQRLFQAARLLVTLPLGVLQQQGAGGVLFEPRLASKEPALRGLAMGAVVKVTLQFHSRFWPVDSFGFIHSEERWLPTWWSNRRGPILTGWAGGPRADELSRESPDALRQEAVQTLARLFQVGSSRIEELLVGFYHHDWIHDPYSRGAYSYTPVRMIDMPARLAAPVANTVFFAGEATVTDGEQGTVQGALASGHRAAQEILASLSGNRTAQAPKERGVHAA